ncbi:hypothetical protein OK074_9072, partial [Actinobacteria bacterium OK074]
MSSHRTPRRRRLVDRTRWVVVTLCTVLAVPTVLSVPAVASGSGDGLGKISVPTQQHAKLDDEITSQGAKKARAKVAAQKAANKKQAARADTEQTATWPKPGTATTPLPPSGKAKLTPGGLPVTVAAAGTKKPAAGTAHVQLLSRTRASAAGVNGLLLTASSTTPGKAQLALDYGKFASAYGGDWAGRLHLVTLPACALTTPNKAACRTQTPLASDNNATAQTVSATTELATTATVVALAATSGESTSGSGNYAASTLNASSTWEAGGSSGAFTWSYPMSTPSPAA